VRRWKLKTRNIIELTKPARDLEHGDVDFVVMVLNSNPDVDGIVHRHSPECTCGGRRHFKTMVKKALGMLFSAGCPVCLMYRFKGFEHASSFMLRGMLLFNILPRCLHQMFDKQSLEQAEAAAQAAAAHGDVNHSANNSIRAKKLTAFVDRDRENKSLLMAVICNAPFHIYLNRLFKADAARQKFVIRQEYQSPELPDDEHPDHVAELELAARESRDEARKFLDGTNALALQRSSADLLFDSGSSGWHEAGWTDEQFFSASLRLLTATGSAFFRTEFRFQQPKFEILRACVNEYSEDDIATLVGDIRGRARACASCVDASCSFPWVGKLGGPRPRHAHRFLFNCLASMPLTSLNEERKHLLGQEIKRKRGRTVSPFSLSVRTYRKFVRAKLFAKMAAIKDDVCKRHGIKPIQVTTALKRLSGRRGFRRIANDKPVVREGKVRNTSAWSMFRSLNKTPNLRPQSIDHKQDMQRLGRLWRDISSDPLARAVYDQMAAQKNNKEVHAQMNPAAPLAYEGELVQRRIKRRRASSAISSIGDHRCPLFEILLSYVSSYPVKMFSVGLR